MQVQHCNANAHTIVHHLSSSPRPPPARLLPTFTYVHPPPSTLPTLPSTSAQVQHAVRLIKAKLAGGANAQPMPGGLVSSGDAVTEEMMVQRDAAGGLIGKARQLLPPP